MQFTSFTITIFIYSRTLKNYGNCMHAALSQSVNLHKVFTECHWF